MRYSALGKNKLERYEFNKKLFTIMHTGYRSKRKSNHTTYQGCGAVLSFLIEHYGKTNETLSSELESNTKAISNLRKKKMFTVEEIMIVAVAFQLDYKFSILMLEYTGVEWKFSSGKFDEEIDKILYLANDKRNFEKEDK